MNERDFYYWLKGLLTNYKELSGETLLWMIKEQMKVVWMAPSIVVNSTPSANTQTITIPSFREVKDLGYGNQPFPGWICGTGSALNEVWRAAALDQKALNTLDTYGTEEK